MANKDDDRVLIFYSRKLIILLKISGVLPMNPKAKLLKFFSNLYWIFSAFCCVYTIFETLLFFFINAENMPALLSGLWIKGSLLISDFQMIGFFVKRNVLYKITHNCPTVVSNRLGSKLRKYYMRRATRLCYLLVWLYILISVAVSITIEYRTKIFNDGEEEAMHKSENKNDDFLFLSSTAIGAYVQEAIEYVHIFVFTSVGLYQLGYAMIYFQICCFIQGYADHLVESMENLQMMQQRSNENRQWASISDSETVDIRFIATLHQFVLTLIKNANEVFSIQMQLKMWRIILVLCLTAKEITDHAELSSTSAVLAFEFAINMLELFIFGWLAENLIAAENRFRLAVLNRLAAESYINSADYTSLQIISIGSNIQYSLKAGPFYKLSNKTFNAIIAASYSYYSFLRNVKTR